MHLNDDWYDELMKAHAGLTEGQSQRLDAALVLLLVNELAEAAPLRRCLDAARDAVLAQEKS